MTVAIFGKEDCHRCKAAQKKIAFFLNKWGLSETVATKFYDMSTVDGMAEGAFYDVLDIPTTIIFADGKSLARWEGKLPLSSELGSHLQNSLR
jgi:thiol-disulfide isomerase/thioredoxin